MPESSHECAHIMFHVNCVILEKMTYFQDMKWSILWYNDNDQCSQGSTVTLTRRKHSLKMNEFKDIYIILMSFQQQCILLSIHLSTNRNRNASNETFVLPFFFSGLDTCKPAVHSFIHLQCLLYSILPEVRQHGSLRATVFAQICICPPETDNCIALTVVLWSSCQF